MGNGTTKAQLLMPADVAERVRTGMTTDDDVAEIESCMGRWFYRGCDSGFSCGYREGYRLGRENAISELFDTERESVCEPEQGEG